eukprot:COSAG02_NODE_1552_length_11961_cov_12.233182_5_plen_110_part_00
MSVAHRFRQSTRRLGADTPMVRSSPRKRKRRSGKSRRPPLIQTGRPRKDINMRCRAVRLRRPRWKPRPRFGRSGSGTWQLDEWKTELMGGERARVNAGLPVGMRWQLRP